MKKFYLIALLPLIFTITACKQPDVLVVRTQTIEPGSQEAEARPRLIEQPQIIRIGESEPIRSLDPLFSHFTSNQRLNGLIYEGLVGYDATGEIVPVLARSWDVSPDSLIYTFHLHPDARFQDSPAFIDGRGRAVNAEDVKHIFRRMATREVPPQAVQLFTDLIRGFDAFNKEQRELYLSSERTMSDIQGVVAVDNRTVRFVLNRKSPEFLYLLASPYAYIYPKEVASNLNETPVGSGPFRFRRAVSDTLFSLERNSNYWKGGVENFVNTVQIKRYPSEGAKLRALANNDIDILPNITPLLRSMMISRSGGLEPDYSEFYRVIKSTGNDYASLMFNPGNTSEITRAEAASIFQYANNTTLDSLLTVSGLSIKRTVPIGANLPSPFSRIEQVDPAGFPILSFSGYNYDSYLARSIFFAIDGEVNLNLVRSGVISRDITWYVEHLVNFENATSAELGPNELVRFGTPHFSIHHRDIEGFRPNGHSWWMSLYGVKISTNRTPQ